MTTRRVTWRRSDEIEADEHCTLTRRDTGLALVGTVLGAEAGIPVRIEYRVMADASGHTTAVHVRDLRGFEQRAIALERDAKGNWRVDGAPARALRGLHGRRPGLQPVHEHPADPPSRPPRGRREDDPGGVDPVPRADRDEGRPDLHAARRIRPTATRAARSRPSSRSTTKASSRPTRSGGGPGWPSGPRAASRSTLIGRAAASGAHGSARNAATQASADRSGSAIRADPFVHSVARSSPVARSAHAMTAPSRSSRS